MVTSEAVPLISAAFLCNQTAIITAYNYITEFCNYNLILLRSFSFFLIPFYERAVYVFELTLFELVEQPHGR
jgi:hypothetical protein